MTTTTTIADLVTKCACLMCSLLPHVHYFLKFKDATLYLRENRGSRETEFKAFPALHLIYTVLKLSA